MRLGNPPSTAAPEDLKPWFRAAPACSANHMAVGAAGVVEVLNVRTTIIARIPSRHLAILKPEELARDALGLRVCEGGGCCGRGNYFAPENTLHASQLHDGSLGRLAMPLCPGSCHERMPRYAALCLSNKSMIHVDMSAGGGGVETKSLLARWVVHAHSPPCAFQ